MSKLLLLPNIEPDTANKGSSETLIGEMPTEQAAKNMKTFLGFIALCVTCSSSIAELAVGTTASRTVGSKAVITLGLTNSYTDKIDSARATVFLVNHAGKVVGQSTRWVIGGSPEKPGLNANAGTLFHFVVEAKQPFKTNRVFVNQIVLSGGRVITPVTPAENKARE